MEKKIPVNRFFKLFKCFMCLLLLAFMTMSPIYAGAGPEGDDIDVLVEKMKVHFQTELNNAETDEKLQELEERLRNGMSTQESCILCHVDKRPKP